MTNDLNLRLLGGLRLERDHALLTGFVSNKPPALLAYLVVTHRPHSRDTLATLFWGDLPDADAKNNLRQALTNLRRLVEPHLIITRDTIEFNVEAPYFLDVAAFERFVKHPIGLPPDQVFQHLQAAVELYQGEFLEGVFVRDAPDFEEWALTQRTHLRDLALQAFHALTELCLTRGEYAPVIDYASRLLALDPWREEAHRQLMLAYVRSGQPSAALAQYETCRRVMLKEFNAEPSSATTTLYERIRAALASPGSNLNDFPPPSTLIGRERELVELTQRLRDPYCRLITLIGLGGSGKTRLALEAAAQGAGAFLNGVFFVSLAAFDTADRIAPAIAQALGFAFHGEADLKTQFIDYVRDKELLLVLDNFEQVMGASGLVSEILQFAPAVKLLVTSRERLNLRSEWLLEVPGLPLPPAGCAPTEIDAYSAAALFLHNARRVRADLALDVGTASAIARICQLVDGLPLGLELAATWTHSLSCSDIAAEIERGLDILSTTQPDVPDRQRSLRTVFDYSWRRLSAAERVLFRRLAVFRGGFQREAAEAVCDASLASLTTLLEKSLLRRSAHDRFEMHELIDQYAREQLSAAPEEQAQLHDRHCRYFAAYASQRQARLKGDTPTIPRAEIQHEMENIRSGWHYAIASAQAPLVEGIEQYMEGLFVFWEMNSAFAEGQAAFAQAAAALQAMSGQPERRTLILRANLLARQGWYCFRLARYEAGLELIQHSLTLLRQLDAGEELGYPLLFAGACAFGSGKLTEARQLFLDSCAVYRRRHDAWGIAGVLNNLGQVSVALGEYTEARQFLEESLQLTEAAQIRHLRVHVLGNLSELNLAAQDYPAARHDAAQALALAREIEEQYLIATQLSRLGAVETMLGEYAAAERCFREALDIAISLGNRWEQANCLNRLGEVMLNLDRLIEAQRYFRQALSLAWNIGAASIALNSLHGLASLWTRRGETQPALELAYFILHHSDSEQWAKDKAQQLSDQLAVKLSSRKVAEALHRGRTRQLDAIVREVLSDNHA